VVRSRKRIFDPGAARSLFVLLWRRFRWRFGLFGSNGSLVFFQQSPRACSRLRSQSGSGLPQSKALRAPRHGFRSSEGRRTPLRLDCHCGSRSPLQFKAAATVCRTAATVHRIATNTPSNSTQTLPPCSMVARNANRALPFCSSRFLNAIRAASPGNLQVARIGPVTG